MFPTTRYHFCSSFSSSIFFFSLNIFLFQQAYAHKILTGRRSLFHTIKQKNGLSGFTSRFESEYDPFGAGHGCNSLSAGLGIASICSSLSCMSNCLYVIHIFYACGIGMLLRSYFLSIFSLLCFQLMVCLYEKFEKVGFSFKSNYACSTKIFFLDKA
jgi:hypothetical protein